MNQKCWFACIFFILSICCKSLGQTEAIEKTKSAIFQTNIFIIPKLEQWSIGIEVQTKMKSNVSNYVSVIRNRFFSLAENVNTNVEEIDQNRRSIDVKYNRKYYVGNSDMFSNNAFFHSPYLSLRFRDVYQKGYGGGIVSFGQANRDFNSTSLVIGEDLGLVLFNKNNKVNLSVLFGGGIGKVLYFSSVSDYDPNSFHADIHGMLNLGFPF
jgi:hypothetical protein